MHIIGRTQFLQEAVNAKSLVLFRYNGEQRVVKALAIEMTRDRYSILRGEEIIPDLGKMKTYRVDRIESPVQIVNGVAQVEPQFVDYVVTLKIKLAKGSPSPITWDWQTLFDLGSGESVEWQVK